MEKLIFIENYKKNKPSSEFLKSKGMPEAMIQRYLNKYSVDKKQISEKKGFESELLKIIYEFDLSNFAIANFTLGYDEHNCWLETKSYLLFGWFSGDCLAQISLVWAFQKREILYHLRTKVLAPIGISLLFYFMNC